MKLGRPYKQKSEKISAKCFLKNALKKQKSTRVNPSNLLPGS